MYSPVFQLNTYLSWEDFNLCSVVSCSTLRRTCALI
nr:MAG TPA: hypothetical protein [Caudoviricetes sp.]